MRKLLIIEDDVAIAGLYRIVFTKRNYSVDIAVHGEEGMEKIKANKPDLILLDIMMPKMNGLQVIQKLKADAEYKDIPIFVLSNLMESSTESTMLKEGALKFIVKSQYLPDQIVDIVDEYFKQPVTSVTEAS